ncbi:MAG: TIGR00180 family glycosyltransferase [Vicinamibacterales bacterium]
MTPADNLTIVLTIKDRTAFTYRWMQYMNDCKCPYPILIADGGEDDAIAAHLGGSGAYPHLRYTYLRYDVDRDYEVFYQKFADVLGQVATPYLLLADNDDFFFLEHIPTFTAFLDHNQGYVSCGGQPILLYLLSRSGELVGAVSAGQYRAVADVRPKSVSDEQGVERACYFLTNVRRHRLWSTWYQVHRSSAVKEAIGLVRRYAFTDPVALEIHVHLSLLMAGKYHQCEAPFWVGQHGTSQLTSALEAQGSVVERFIKANSFADLHRSLETFAGLSVADRERILGAIAGWFAGCAVALSPVPPIQAAPSGGDAVERAYRAARRLARPLAAIFRSPPPAREQLRLPALEKYILDPAVTEDVSASTTAIAAQEGRGVSR